MTDRAEANGSNAKRSPLTVSALLVLVAATAPGLAITRTLPTFLAFNTQADFIEEVTGPAGGMGWSGYHVTSSVLALNPAGRPFKDRASYWMTHLPYWSGPCLVSWTLASVALGLRSPKPPWRRLARKPGMAAGLALLLALVVKSVQFFVFLTINGTIFTSMKDGWRGPSADFWVTLPGLAGYTVAASWLVLALSGRWPADSGPQDRLGRAFGWCWIAMAASITLGFWCFSLNY